MTSYAPFQREYDIASQIAKQASDCIMSIYERTFDIKHKPNEEGPVTEADMAANKIIVSELKKHFPNDAILSEEDPDDLGRLKYNRVWCIDPIDGTREFISHNGEFAIHIGLIVDHKAAFGLVHLPAHNITAWGGPSIGAFWNKKGSISPIRVSQNSIHQLTLLATRSHFNERDEEFKRKLNAAHQFRFGSVGGKAIHIASGQADVFFYSTDCTKSWDTCAPEALIRGAGGMMTDCAGNDLIYNRENIRNAKGVVVTNGICHKDVLKLFV